MSRNNSSNDCSIPTVARDKEEQSFEKFYWLLSSSSSNLAWRVFNIDTWSILLRGKVANYRAGSQPFSWSTVQFRRFVGF
jgi:hypothetical protein